MSDSTQNAISRQSSLKLFQTYFEKMIEGLPLQYVLRINEIISDYTLNGNTPEIVKTVKAIDQFLEEQKTIKK